MFMTSHDETHGNMCNKWQFLCHRKTACHISTTHLFAFAYPRELSFVTDESPGEIRISINLSKFSTEKLVHHHHNSFVTRTYAIRHMEYRFLVRLISTLRKLERIPCWRDEFFLPPAVSSSLFHAWFTCLRTNALPAR